MVKYRSQTDSSYLYHAKPNRSAHFLFETCWHLISTQMHSQFCSVYMRVVSLRSWYFSSAPFEVDIKCRTSDCKNIMLLIQQTFRICIYCSQNCVNFFSFITHFTIRDFNSKSFFFKSSFLSKGKINMLLKNKLHFFSSLCSSLQLHFRLVYMLCCHYVHPAWLIVVSKMKWSQMLG